MRTISLLCLLWSLSVVSSKADRTQSPSQDQPKIPTTLAEAHAELERTLPPEELAKIDAMQSEDEMIQYHMGLGTGIRNSWGLWSGGPLAKHMQELGFTHPDHMSGVILETFWCKHHGKDFRLKERGEASRRAMNAQERAHQEEKKLIQESNAAIQNMMMGLRFRRQDVPTVQIPAERGASVRFMCPFRGGAFVAIYCQGSIDSGSFHIIVDGDIDPATGSIRIPPDRDDFAARGYFFDKAQNRIRKAKPGEDFYILGWYLDRTERKMHRICVPEVSEVYATIVVGERAWFAGCTNGKMALVGIADQDRIAVPLPQDDEIPDLGMDGQSLLAVYSKTIYRLADGAWMQIHSGDMLLPRSGLPPQRYANMVFLRDEGTRESNKRLWWLTMGDKLHLHLLERNTGLFVPVAMPDGVILNGGGPYEWGAASSYCLTSNGDLWACVAGGSYLLRRSQDGNYTIAVANNSVQFTEYAPDKRQTNPEISISAVTALPDDTLLLACNMGLYHLKGIELTQKLRFIAAQIADNREETSDDGVKTPNHILMLDDHTYVIAMSMWDGVYLIHKGDDGHWSCLPVERAEDTVLW